MSAPDAPVARSRRAATDGSRTRRRRGAQSALLILNPRAGVRANSREIERVVRAAAELGWRLDVVETLAAGDASLLAANAVRAGQPIVLAGGGDGTLNEVVQSLVGTTTAVGAVPLGTVNVWARELGLSLDPAEATASAAARPGAPAGSRAGQRTLLPADGRARLRRGGRPRRRGLRPEATVRAARLPGRRRAWKRSARVATACASAPMGARSRRTPPSSPSATPGSGQVPSGSRTAPRRRMAC